MMIAFAILAAILVVSALGVVLAHNPVYSAIWLILNMLTVAGLFALLDAHFLAVAQVIVYAGAIMVLFLFVIMLLNVKGEEPKKRSLLYVIFSWGSGLAFAGLLGQVFLRGFRVLPTISMADQLNPPPDGTTKAIGHLLYTEYVFPFEAASLLLIVAIVGSVMLAKRRYGSDAHLPPAKEVQ